MSFIDKYTTVYNWQGPSILSCFSGQIKNAHLTRQNKTQEINNRQLLCECGGFTKETRKSLTSFQQSSSAQKQCSQDYESLPQVVWLFNDFYWL